MKNIFKTLFGKENKNPENKEKPYFSDVLLVTDYELDFKPPQNETQTNITAPKQNVKQNISTQKNISQSVKLLNEKDFDVNKINGFQLTTEFEVAFDLIEKKKETMLITGKAGTGKSTLLLYFRQNTRKNVIFLAPTGVAALNIGGKTIHSVFQFPAEIITKSDVFDKKDKLKIKYNAEKRELFDKVDTIVIDEISMVRADLIEGIDFVLRYFRDKNKMFGGVQMIFFGDLYQLPPVVDPKDTVTIISKNNRKIKKNAISYFNVKFGGCYFFCYQKMFWLKNLKYYELTNIFRQNDKEFIDILNAIREKNITNNDFIQQINQRCMKSHNEDGTIRLCTRTATANNINAEKLEEIKLQKYEYHAIKTGIFANIVNEKDFPADNILKLKVGAKIMMVKNDKKEQWVNGSIGTVISLDDNNIHVNVGGVDCSVDKETWETFEYEYNTETKELEKWVVGTFEQYPIKLAWAITIHKSQGKTFDSITVDLETGAFCHGQTYVALSRCKTLNGIQLIQPVKNKDIIVENQIVSFITRIIQKQRKNIKDKVNNAILKKNKIKIFYEDGAGKQSIKIITPIKFTTAKKDTIKALYHKESGDEFRDFKMDRIKR